MLKVKNKYFFISPIFFTCFSIAATQLAHVIPLNMFWKIKIYLIFLKQRILHLLWKSIFDNPFCWSLNYLRSLYDMIVLLKQNSHLIHQLNLSVLHRLGKEERLKIKKMDNILFYFIFTFWSCFLSIPVNLSDILFVNSTKSSWLSISLLNSITASLSSKYQQKKVYNEVCKNLNYVFN